MGDERDGSTDGFKNRKIYTSFDLRTLERIPDHELEQAILDYVCLKMEADPDREAEVLAGLSAGFRAVFTTMHAEGEVNNGGFNQYFWNSEGRTASQAIEGFRHIGAHDYADLLIRAVALWQEERPALQSLKDREDILQAFSESYGHTSLGSLDDAFFGLARNADLSQMRIRHIRTHPHEFVTYDGPHKIAG